MKILIIMAGFLPGKKYGGPPISVNNFCSLMDEFECRIVTTNHDLGEHKAYSNISGGWNKRGNCNVKYLDDSQYNKSLFEEIILEYKPDCIYLQGLFQSCIIPCLQLAKKYRIRVLLAPRGELCSGALKKKYKKIPYIIIVKLLGLLKDISFQATSNEEIEAIIRWLRVPKEKIYYLTNIPSFTKLEFETNIKIKGHAKLIFISRIVPKKNLLFAIKCLHKVKGNVTFDIYGPIEDKNYWDSCKNEIINFSPEITVNYCGLVSHDDVHHTMSQYDVFLFPTLSENYGHVISEALAVGTPVIISNQTPWTEVNMEKIGWALPLDNEDGFVNAIQKIVDMNMSEYSSLRENVKNYMHRKGNLDQIKTSYKEAFQKIIKNT